MIEFKYIFSFYLKIHHFRKLSSMIIVKYINHIKQKDNRCIDIACNDT